VTTTTDAIGYGPGDVIEFRDYATQAVIISATARVVAKTRGCRLDKLAERLADEVMNGRLVPANDDWTSFHVVGVVSTELDQASRNLHEAMRAERIAKNRQVVR
jgi:hypothetical protein